MRFDQKFTIFLRELAIYGTAPVAIPWQLRRRDMKINTLDSGRITAGKTKKGGVKRGVPFSLNQDGPDFCPLDILDFYTDPQVLDHQESYACARRLFRTPSELKRMQDQGLYFNVEDGIKKDQDTRGTNAGAREAVRQSRLYNMGFQNPITASGASGKGGRPNMQTIIEYWGLFKVRENDRLDTEVVISVLNDKTVIQLRPNFFTHGLRPFVVGQYTRRHLSFYSKGVIEPIVDLSRALDDHRNCSHMSDMLHNSPMIGVPDVADLPDGPLHAFPGKRIPLPPGTTLQPIVSPATSQVAFRHENALKIDIGEVTGATRPLQGSTDSPYETATAFTGRVREGNIRLLEVADNMGNDVLKPFLEMSLAMNQQFLPKGALIETLGAEGLKMETVTPEQMAGRYVFEITTLPGIELAGIQSNVMMGFLQQAAVYEQLMPGTINPAEVLRRVWQAQFGPKGIDKVIPSAGGTGRPSAMEEHLLFKYDRDVQPDPNENLLAHAQAHNNFMNSPQFEMLPEMGRRRMRVHFENTKILIQRKLEETMMQQAAQGQPPPPQAGSRPTGSPQGQIRQQAQAGAPTP